MHLNTISSTLSYTTIESLMLSTPVHAHTCHPCSPLPGIHGRVVHSITNLHSTPSSSFPELTEFQPSSTPSSSKPSRHHLHSSNIVIHSNTFTRVPSLGHPLLGYTLPRATPFLGTLFTRVHPDSSTTLLGYTFHSSTFSLGYHHHSSQTIQLHHSVTLKTASPEPSLLHSIRAYPVDQHTANMSHSGILNPSYQ